MKGNFSQVEHLQLPKETLTAFTKNLEIMCLQVSEFVEFCAADFTVLTIMIQNTVFLGLSTSDAY